MRTIYSSSLPRSHICISGPERAAGPRPPTTLKYRASTAHVPPAWPPPLPPGGLCAKLAPQKAGLDSMRHRNAKTLFAGVQNRLRKHTGRAPAAGADGPARAVQCRCLAAGRRRRRSGERARELVAVVGSGRRVDCRLGSVASRADAPRLSDRAPPPESADSRPPPVSLNAQLGRGPAATARGARRAQRLRRTRAHTRTLYKIARHATLLNTRTPRTRARMI